jgi:multiple sugar transport system ATP-binding protein
VVPLPSGPPGEGPWELGIRPEALAVVTDGGSTGATATVVERLGDRTLIHAKLADGIQVIAQDSGKSVVRAGDRVRLSFDASALHLFDGQGRAVAF